MNIAHAIPSTVTSLSFSFLTTEDVRRISVKQVVNPALLDDLNRPSIGGLYDPALGPSTRQDICATCHLNYFLCPGHFGHIELPATVYHPLFLRETYNLLRTTCLFCHKFKASRTVKCKYIGKLRLLERGLVAAATSLDKLNPVVKQRAPGVEEDDTDEAEAEFIQRINLFVAVSLRQAGDSNRDDYKNGLAYQMRKQTIADFLKSAYLKKCANCLAHSYTFRKEGHTKIIELDIPTKQKDLHVQLGLKRPNVLLSSWPSAPSNSPTPDGENNEDSDVDMEDAESSSSDSESDPAGKQLPRTAHGALKTARGRNERVMAPAECRAHLRRLFANDSEICSLLFGRHGPFAPISKSGLSIASADMFFMDVIPVSPTRFRPPAKLGDTLFEHPQNEMLTKVLNTTYRIRDLNTEIRSLPKDSVEARNKLFATELEALIQLQIDVNSFMDSSKNPTPLRQGKLPPAGVKQGLEKKEGLFRMHMMGKRVNYAARSVISPDVNIETNEIGIPPIFAKTLTFPEPVTPLNVHEMRQLVIRGPQWPGASMVQYEDGTQIQLDTLGIEQRTAIANQLLTPQEGNRAASASQGLTTRTMTVNKKVFRHLRDGDVLLLNRQPTLHKPSMMAHRARVLKGEKTIRMHYANCNSYNADFDGDEMNIHFPQNQIPRAEAMTIANTDNQYLVPTSGEPLRGLIQDHVVSAIWMTNKNTWFTREEYQQILYGALRPEDFYSGHGRVITLPPAMWKPKPLWSGKQIISTVLVNITPDNAKGLTLTSKAKVSNEHWGPHSSEQSVIFVDGELLCGVLDKSQFGATSYGLVHAVYELYGADTAGRLLSILSRLFTKFLQHRAFTCRMDDLALTPEGEKTRRSELEKAKSYGTEAAIDNFPSLSDPNISKADIPDLLAARLEEVLRDDTKMAGLDYTVKMKVNGLTKTIEDKCMPHGLLRRFPDNHMQTMVMTGAKGSNVNARQISCGLGQQELEGRRVPVMVSGKTLPSFKAFETAAVAGGYVASRFLTGLRPQEFYFHCMAGREGLIDTAVKTSRSGYLQRCLIKHLEGIRVHYDHTVRGSDSSIYQFHYGGDGLDVTKQKYLLGDVPKNPSKLDAKQQQLFEFTVRNIDSVINKTRPKDIKGIVDDEEATAYMKKLLKKPMSQRTKPPALSEYIPSRYLGSTSERFAQAVDDYVTQNPDRLIRSKKDKDVQPLHRMAIPVAKFRTIMNIRYLRALVEPGEAVGLLASQGVGEPSTQMTLNTFHFAGHGAANVTLGIPRLREIVMTASTKPKTPAMSLTVREGVSIDEIDIFCKRASRVTLSQVIDKIIVNESLVSQKDSRIRRFTVKMQFFPSDEYLAEYRVDIYQLLKSLWTTFAPVLKKEVTLELKRLDADFKAQASEIGKGKAVQAGGSGEEDDGEGEPAAERDDVSEVGEGDADDEKRARQADQEVDYEDEDDDEDSDDEDAEGNEDSDANELERIQNEFKETEADEVVTKKKKKSKAEIWAARHSMASENFTKKALWATKFAFEEDGSLCQFDLEFGSDIPKILLVGVIERCCLKTVIREIPGITRCMRVIKGPSDPKDEPEKITAEGSNFEGIWEFAGDIIDVDKIFSNDIYAVLCTYGVEMARTIIMHEIQSVFGAYKINVDARHVSLIADYMTFDGGYKPFNRKGISSNSSPLLKASFESTASFLSDATLFGDFDDLTSPSGNIVLGRPSITGTGVFDIVMPLPGVQ